MSVNFDDMPISTKHQNNVNDINSFDDLPIGNTNNKFAISEYADGEIQQPLKSTANMTTEQKINSKTVKIKLEGLEELRLALNDPQACSQVDMELAKILKQNNPACLEKALQCADKWMDLNKSWGEKQIKEIVQNGCVNGKGATKKLATDLIFKAYQTRPEEVQRTIVQTGLKGKVPKIIGGYLALLNELLQQFGIKELKYLKPYIASVVYVMNNQKLPVVKAQGMNLFKSGFKWLGKDFLWPLLSDLKENMKKQLESFWQGHDKKEVMRANRQKNMETVPVKSEGTGKVKGKESAKNQPEQFQSGGLDIYEISDPIQVLQKFDQRWADSVLEAEKWNVKTALLQQIITKTSVPKIANSEHRHITEMIRRLLNDSNFNVVLAVLKLSASLAKSLRKNFSHSAKQLFPYITPKFRDKKTQMIEETYNTLNNFCYCFSLQEVGEDIKVALKDKTVGMKNNVIKWMTLFIERRQGEAGADRIADFLRSSSIQGIVESLLNDPSAEVRDSTTKLVCRARTAFGQGMFKNVDKNISNKDILQKLAQGITDNEQPLTKSRSKETSNTKPQKSLSKTKSSKKLQQQQQYESTSKNTYGIKTNSKGCETIDITEELNKNLKKLNDSANWQNRKQSAERLIRYFGGIEKTGGKIVSPVLYDFLGVLKARIADPNKQLIKVFVNLVGEVFKYLSEKQAKIQAKFFMQELIEAFSDKNQPNRKQINKTLDSIATAIGPETTISYMGQILSQESNNNNNSSASITKQYALEYLVNSSYLNNRVDQLDTPTNLRQFKEFPKVILTGLCDKNKELRQVSEKLFRIMGEKIGTEVFRNFVNSKDQKLAFKGDLTAFLDKFEGLSANQQPSIISNGSNLSTIHNRQEGASKRSPSINRSKIGAKQEPEVPQKSRRKLSNVTSLCNSRSKGKNNSLLGCEQNSKDFNSNLSFYLKGEPGSGRRIAQGEYFAPLQVLTSQRIQREQCSTKYRNSQSHPILQQSQTQSSIFRLLHPSQLSQKMYSNDYTKTHQATQKLLKLSRDIAQTNSIRQVYDLLIKWVVVRLYGGNVAAMPLVEVVGQVLAVLEKKGVGLLEGDLEAVVCLGREYAVGMFYDGNQSIQVLKNIFKLTMALSSGQRLLRKLLTQLKTDITHHHRHLSHNRKQPSCTKFYKKILIQICCSFIEYFSNDGLLGEAATIPELCQDGDFVRLLANRFQEGVLREFGFKVNVNVNVVVERQRDRDRGKEVGQVVGVNLEKSFNYADKSLNSPRDGSPIAYFGGDKNKNDSKTKKVTPQKKNPYLNDSQFPPPSPISKVRSITQSIVQPEQTLHRKQPITILSVCKNLGIEPFPDRYEIDTSGLPHPSHHNPLGSNLNKLYPFNQSSIHFFSTLFQPQNQNSDKISTELSTHSTLIYSTLINTLIKTMQQQIRESQGPQKICIYMSLIQQSIKCPSIYKNVHESTVERSIRYVIDQLVYEDQNRGSIQMRLRAKGFCQFKSDVFVKGINGIMLRLLDHSYPLFLVNVLLFSIMEVLLSSRNSEEYSHGHVNRNKKIGLLIRCFNRVTNTYFAPTNKQKQPQNIHNIDQQPSCLKPPHIQKFLLLTKQYLSITNITDLLEFQTKQSQKLDKMQMGTGSNCSTSYQNQQSVLLGVCKIIRVLGRKNLLLRSYEIVRKEKGWGDGVLGEFVMTVSGMVGGHNHDNNPTLSNNNYQDPTHNTYAQRIDEQLRKVVQMLSKAKTFQEGVKHLKLYIQQSGGKFDYKNVFAKMNFEPAFINKVSEELGKLNIVSSQGSSRSLNPDIQNKLQRLKMKLEGINNEHSKSISSKMMEESDKSSSIIKINNTSLNVTNMSGNGPKTQEILTPRGRDMADRSMQQSTSQNELKKRIEEMKNKVSMSNANIVSTNTNKIR